MNNFLRSFSSASHRTAAAHSISPLCAWNPSMRQEVSYSTEAEPLVSFWCRNISSSVNFNFPFNFAANLGKLICTYKQDNYPYDSIDLHNLPGQFKIISNSVQISKKGFDFEDAEQVEMCLRNKTTYREADICSDLPKIY